MLIKKYEEAQRKLTGKDKDRDCRLRASFLYSHVKKRISGRKKSMKSRHDLEDKKLIHTSRDFFH